LAQRPVLGVSAASLVVMVASIVALGCLVAGIMPSITQRAPRTAGEPNLTSAFIQAVMALLTLLSAIGVVWGGATALIIAPCVALR
jgi:hypothetical protein